MKFFLVTVALTVCNVMVSMAAGNASQALDSATSEVKGAFNSAANLMLAIGAIVGIIGGITCYSKFSGGDPEGGKKIAKWIGGCVFLCLVPTILRAFFGV